MATLKLTFECSHSETTQELNGSVCNLCATFVPKLQSSRYETIKEPQFCFATTHEINPAHLYLSMLEDEARIPTYRTFNPRATFFNYIPDLRAFIYEAGTELLQRKSTQHIALQYLVAVLSKVDFPKSRLGLVAGTCMLLAAKFDELDNNVPLFDDILSAMLDSKHLKQFEQKFASHDLEQCEAFLLGLLEWNLVQLTPFQALSELLALGISVRGDKRLIVPEAKSKSQRRKRKAKQRIEPFTSEDLKLLRELALHFVELGQLVYRTQEFAPTVVASACVLAARKKARVQPLWNDTLRDLTQHSYEELLDCMNLLLLNFETLNLGKRTVPTEELLGESPLKDAARTLPPTSEDSTPQVCAKRDPKVALTKVIDERPEVESPRKKTSPPPIITTEATSPLFMYESDKARELKNELQQRCGADTASRRHLALPPPGKGTRLFGFETTSSPLSMQENSFSKGFKSTSASSRFSQDSASSNNSRVQLESVGRRCAPNARIEAHPTVKIYSKKNGQAGTLTVVPSQSVITSITQSRSSAMLETLGAPKGNTMQLYEKARGFTLSKQVAQSKSRKASPTIQRSEHAEVSQKSEAVDGVVRGRGRSSNRNAFFTGSERGPQLLKASLGGGSSRAQGFLPPLTN